MTDLELQTALAKMLPEDIKHRARVGAEWFVWSRDWNTIRSTEWLHVCWLVEQTLCDSECDEYSLLLGTWLLEESKDERTLSISDWHAPWQIRAQALCRVKGVQ